MDENVLAAAVRRDETKAFGGIEELHGADGHCISFRSSDFAHARCMGGREKRHQSLKEVFGSSGARRAGQRDRSASSDRDVRTTCYYHKLIRRDLQRGEQNALKSPQISGHGEPSNNAMPYGSHEIGAALLRVRGCYLNQDLPRIGPCRCPSMSPFCSPPWWWSWCPVPPTRLLWPTACGMAAAPGF